MGIKNLFSELKDCTVRCHISQFRGQRIAIDGFTWLHKASYYCAKDLFHNPSTDKILPHLDNKLKILIENEIKPIIVFDGRPLPSKRETDQERHSKREAARKKILQEEKEGKTVDYYNQAISIQYDTVKTFITYLKQKNIEYIVAPYEADSQLTYFAKTNYADVVMTEDSDLLTFGSPQILIKFDEENGNVFLIKLENVLNTMKLSNFDEFLNFCILSGCDYAPHIKNMGVKTALNLVQKFHGNIDNILKSMKNSPKFNSVNFIEYRKLFERARKTFLHQKVYDVLSRKMVPLTETEEEFDFAGELIDEAELQLHVTGEINSRIQKVSKE